VEASAFDAARGHFLQGLADLQAGRLSAAETALRASLALLPGRPSSLSNLAVALLRQGRAAEALPLLDEVLAQEPDAADALGHRGAALNELGRNAEAVATFERLLRADPARPQGWFHLAQALHMQGRLDEAVDAYGRCLHLQPDHALARSQRGGALKALGRLDEARADFEQALALAPEDDAEINRYQLASLGAAEAPPASPRAYVQRLFDDYADGFDQHLVGTLGYVTPNRLQQLLAGLGRRFDSALDLGCGTGLCGPLLRPLAQRLTGVDLSPRMLALARQRAVYDALHEAELLAHLHDAGADGHDLIVAADVFVYIGDLAPVFGAVARVLRAGGVFAFSVEAAPAAQAVVLQQSLRYAHGEQALRALADAQGFEVLHDETGALRGDAAHALHGHYWVMQRR
jgi:predicted TPR repeat methyltransferase